MPPLSDCILKSQGLNSICWCWPYLQNYPLRPLPFLTPNIYVLPIKHTYYIELGFLIITEMEFYLLNRLLTVQNKCQTKFGWNNWGGERLVRNSRREIVGRKISGMDFPIHPCSKTQSAVGGGKAEICNITCTLLIPNVNWRVEESQWSLNFFSSLFFVFLWQQPQQQDDIGARMAVWKRSRGANGAILTSYSRSTTNVKTPRTPPEPQR